MVIYGHGKAFFCLVLADNIFIKLFFDLRRSKELKLPHSLRRSRKIKFVIFFRHEVITQLYAFVADIHSGTGNEAFDFILPFAAK